MIFMDSFSGYATAQLATKFNGGVIGAVTINPGTGRHGNNSLRCSDSGHVDLVLKVPTSDIIVGFGILNADTPILASNTFIELMTTTDESQKAAQVRWTDGSGAPIGGISVFAGSSSHVNSANNLWVQAAYFHLQIRVKTTSYTGGVLSVTVTVKLNNVIVATVSGTVTTPVGKVNIIRFINVGSGSCDYSDLYIIDMDDGIAPTDFISPTGDLDVSPLFPDANGITNSWTPLSAPNFSQVNEHPPDGDTTYVASPTVGAIDLYHFPADNSIAPAGSVIYGVQENIFAKKDDPAGSRNISTLTHIASSGLNYNGIDTIALGNNYQYYYNCMGKNLATGNPWQLGEVGGLGSQFGQMVLS